MGMTIWKFRECITEHTADINLNWCRTANSKLNQGQDVMIDFKETKTIKKLSNYRKFVLMKSIEILHLANYTCKDTLSYIIPKIWYSILKITCAPPLL